MESLERRTLFCYLHDAPSVDAASAAAAAESIRVDFQPAGSTTEAGYLADTGLKQADRGNGYNYGWSIDNSANARERDADPRRAYDTINQTQKNGQSPFWQIGLPEGYYDVRLVAGDASYFDSTFSFDIEGKSFLKGTPSSGNRFVEATGRVFVSGGNLTLKNGSGAKNNKVALIEIAPADVGQPASGWTSGKKMPVALGEVASAVVRNVMYVIGSGNTSTLGYDLASGTWLPAGQFAKRPVYGDHHSVQVVGNKMYVIGGLLGAGGKVQVFDPAANSWTTKASMPWDGGSVATAVVGGKIYAFGGVVGSTPSSYRGTGSTNKAAVYDIEADEWTMLPSMPEARHHTATATDGQRIWIFGGRDGPNDLANGSPIVQVFDPQTNTWATSETDSSIHAMPVARSGFGAAIYHAGKFVMMGGETRTGAGATNQLYKRVDVYDPSAGVWSTLPNMPTAKHGMYPTLVGSKVYVAGGGAKVGISQSDTMDVLQL